MHDEILAACVLLDGYEVKKEKLAKGVMNRLPPSCSCFVFYGQVVDDRWLRLDGALVVMCSIIAVGWAWLNGGWLLCRGN